MITSQLSIKNAFNSLCIDKKSVIHIQTDLSKIGPIKDLKKKSDYLIFYYKLFSNLVGKDGTISVYTFNLDYGRFQTPHDVELTKSQGCAFSEYIRCLDNSHRSIHPLVSISSIGKCAFEITNENDHVSGFGVTSPWAKLIKKKTLFLSIGLGLNESGGTSFIHYLESLFGVPYKYDKIFKTPVYKNKKRINKEFSCSVTYKDYDIVYDTRNYKKNLLRKKLAKRLKIGNGEIYLVMPEAVDYTFDLLSKDRYLFLKNEPVFKTHKYPIK